MSDAAEAIRELITYMKQLEVRQTVGSSLALIRFHDNQPQVSLRYFTALESGDDEVFIDALQSSPYPYDFVTESMKKEGA